MFVGAAGRRVLDRSGVDGVTSEGGGTGGEARTVLVEDGTEQVGGDVVLMHHVVFRCIWGINRVT